MECIEEKIEEENTEYPRTVLEYGDAPIEGDREMNEEAIPADGENKEDLDDEIDDIFDELESGYDDIKEGGDHY